MHRTTITLLAGLSLVTVAVTGAPVRAELPTGYLVWSKGKELDPASRKIYRMTLPGKSDEKALTTGEDVECQISPDGRWVAYAKAKAAGIDYHKFKLWNVYLVSIHGVGQGRKEIMIDEGYWPSWGGNDLLYYSQVDPASEKQTKIIKVTLDQLGQVKDKQVYFETKSEFSSIKEVNECFVAPDGTWFAARTRGANNGIGAYQINPPKFHLLAKAGDIGCMPYIAPSGTWGLIAGSDQGIRWGHAPGVSNRLEDQLLIPPTTQKHKAYHPGISTDEKWVMAAMGVDQDHNSGPYDIFIYKLDPTTKKISDEQQLAVGGFNGWPHIWVGTPTAPQPSIEKFRPDAYTIVKGGQVTLSWIAYNADQVELDSQPVQAEDSQTMSPTADTTYTLVAKSSTATEHPAQATVEITVNDSPQAVAIDNFAADRESIEQGQSVKLSWQVSNPTTLELDGGELDHAWISPSGTIDVSPKETVEYTLTANGHQGPVSKKLKITVAEIKQEGPAKLEDQGGFVCAVNVDMDADLAPPGLGLFLLLVLLALRWPLQRSRRGR